jgi:nicotinamide-nucleotide amidase
MSRTVDTAAIHERLRAAGATVAVAESLTGGRLCAALTETPGASITMRGGLVVYATDLKASLAGVDPALLAERGAVDPQVAAALADGARTRLSATFGLGVTGVAGPDPQDGRRVGTVFGAVAGPAGSTGRAWTFEGDRAAIQAAAVIGCLQLLAEAVAAAAE